VAGASGPIMVVLATWIVVKKDVVWREAVNSLECVPSVLHYGLRAFFISLALMMSIQVGVFIVGCFLPKAEVGFYAIALGIALQISILPNSLRTVLMPRLAKQDNVDGMLVFRAIRIMIPITAVGAICLAVVSSPIIKHGFGEEFMPVVGAVYILLFGAVSKSAGEIVTTYLLAVNRPGVNSFVRFITLSVNIALLSLLVPAYGLVGGCVATTLSYVFEAVAMILVFRGLSGIKSWHLLVLQKDDINYLRNAIFALTTRLKPQI